MGTPRSYRAPVASPELNGERGSGRTWLRSFGRRRGRRLSDRKSLLLANDLDLYKIDISQKFGEEQLSDLFSAPVQEIWLDIGFGAGEHLAWQAERHPHVGLIGAEPYLNGVAAAISTIKARGLGDRIRLHPDDAMPLLDWLPAASISRAFLLFPDPWPKSRHRARRFLSPFSLDKLARLLRPGSELRFASDVADYAESTIHYADMHPDFEIGRVFNSSEREAMADWPVTRYEAKANKAGRSSHFIVLNRSLRRGEMR